MERSINNKPFDWKGKPGKHIHYKQDLLENPKLLDVVLKELQNDLVREENNALILFVIVLSAKLLKEPLGAILLGASSSGKSQLMKAIEKHFPKGIGVKTVTEVKEKGNKTIVRDVERPDFKEGFGIVNINDLTVASLCRISEENRTFFKEKSIMVGELPQNATDNQKQVQQIIRQLISEGRYARLIVGEDRKNIYLELEGHPGFISADASQKIDEQLANRVFLLAPDESQIQSRRIQEFQGLRHAEPWRFNHNGNPSSSLQTLIEQIEPMTVFNPWDKEIVEHLHQRYGKKVQIRRLNELVFKFIDVITLIRQYRRKRYKHQADGNVSYLKVEREDIRFAFEILNPILEQTISRVMKSALLYLNMIREHFSPIETQTKGADNKAQIINQSIIIPPIYLQDKN